MEVLSGVASGMAVASLSIQLLDSVRKLQRFIADVKGASKELKRLLVLLDRLHALLGDVRDIMERQSVLESQHFPAPPTTIHQCLKSCEDSLDSLEGMIDKYKIQQKGDASIASRVKNDVRFGFRIKDIAATEDRIQREIDSLNTALIVNLTAISQCFLPLFKFKHAARGTTLVKDVRNMNTQVRQSWIPSALTKFGIYQRKSEYYLRSDKTVAISKSGGTNDVVSESHEILFAWTILRFGLQWAKPNASNVIFTSLSVYPVVESLWKYDYLIEGPLDMLQQAFSTGKLHPHTRDLQGQSLLHLAAFYNRADVCRLLSQHGLKTDVDRKFRSPLAYVLFLKCKGTEESNGIDTFRFLLHECEVVDDLDEQPSTLKMHLRSSSSPYGIISWLWQNLSTVFEQRHAVDIQCALSQNLIHSLVPVTSPAEEHAQMDKIVELMSPEVLQRYRQGHLTFLCVFFMGSWSSLDSQRQGSILLNLIRRLNLSVEELAAAEQMLQEEDGGRYVYRSSILGRRRTVLLEDIGEQHWVLRWVWDVDVDAAAYLLVSEFLGLSLDSERRYPTYNAERKDFYYGGDCWPFSDAGSDLNRDGSLIEGGRWEERFNRRQTNKARKERARSGLKRPRRMPGAWI